ncbi:MAG: DUF1926 domain-containing protein [Burkholderiales bacterium]|nr:DUF1926 domain-containing protein [Burkholderiales bacterium]
MEKTVSLLLGVHAHQPVGNFDHVIDDAQARCYGPFLRAMHAYPEFRFSIHFSGWLYDYLYKRYPAEIRLLKEMVERGQAEIFGAGYTEPVLAVIPYRDRVSQVTRLSKRLEKTLGQTPQGAWLTERVWEATVVPALADAGITYTTVDDYHFLCTGKTAAELDGYFTTEEDGRRLDLFPISEALRYRLPFAPAHEAVAYLESLAKEEGNPAAIYFDDIEKFGIWPETYHWVYEQGWLKDFVEGVLSSKIIRTMRYSDYRKEAKTRGVIYLPTTSYIEMNEWTLPVPAAHHYADLVQESKNSGNFDRNKAFLRGGIWKNFLSRYPESNWMHKRMLALSARYDALPKKSRKTGMQEALFEAQANDAYWHGLFGGLYLPHLRRAIYHAIVRLEKMLDEVSPRPSKEAQDLDLDGCDELFVHNEKQQIALRLDGSASICEWDSYDLSHNFGDTLAAPAEHYHKKIHFQEETEYKGSGIANPHENMGFKHRILPEDLKIEEGGKRLFMDKWWTSLAYRQEAGAENGASFQADYPGGSVRKNFRLEDARLVAEYAFTGEISGGVFSIEIHLAMPSCDGPAGRYRIGEDILGGFGEALAVRNLKSLLLEDDVMGGKVRIALSPGMEFHAKPFFSVSQSEAGFEKIMQAVSITLSFRPEETGGNVSISLEVM